MQQIAVMSLCRNTSSLTRLALFFALLVCLHTELRRVFLVLTGVQAACRWNSQGGSMCMHMPLYSPTLVVCCYYLAQHCALYMHSQAACSHECGVECCWCCCLQQQPS